MTVTRYVNTASTSGGDGTTNNTTGATRAYHTLLAAEAGEQGDAGDDVNIICDGTEDASEVVFLTANWTTSTTNFVLVSVNTGSVHAGTFDTGKYYKELNRTYASGIRSTMPHLKIDGLQIKTAYASSNCINLATFAGRVSNCLAHGDDSSSGQNGISWGASSGTGTIIINDNVVWDFVQYGLRKSGYLTSCTHGIFNNTANNCGYGINLSSGLNSNTEAYNNILVGSATTDWVSSDTITNTDNNITSDTSSPDTAHQSITVDFAGAGDHQTDDTDVVGNGTNLSTGFLFDFTTDCIGEDRGSSWDIGAFQNVGGNLAGTAAGVGGASGELTGAGTLAGTAAGVGGASGDLTNLPSPISGTASGVGGASGALTGSGALAGTVAGTGGATANLEAVGALAGQVDGVAGGAGALTGSGDLAGTADGVGGGNAALTGAGDLSGTANGVGDASGALVGSGALSGTADGVGGASGDLEALGSGAMSGTAGGVGGGSASLTGAGALSGTSDGVSTASGLATGAGALSGTADGAGGANAGLMAFGLLQGTAAGIATAFATASGSGALFGTAAGMSTAAAELLGAGALSGTADGVATASGDLTALDTGAISGTAAGVSGGTGTLTGLGALSGTAAGVSGGGMAMPSVAVYTQTQAQIIAAAAAARMAAVLAEGGGFLKTGRFAAAFAALACNRPPPGEFGKPMHVVTGRNTFPLVELPQMGPRIAAALTLAQFLSCAKFRVYADGAADTLFRLNNVRTQWAKPGENLDYPNASIITATTPAGGENLTPFPLEDTINEFAPNSVLWMTGERTFEFQVDFWLNTDPEREAIEAALPTLFNPSESAIGVILGGHPRYFRRTVRATWVDDLLADDSDSSFERVRRLSTTIRCDIQEVQLRQAVPLTPQLNPPDLGGPVSNP